LSVFVRHVFSVRDSRINGKILFGRDSGKAIHAELVYIQRGNIKSVFREQYGIPAQSGADVQNFLIARFFPTPQQPENFPVLGLAPSLYFIVGKLFPFLFAGWLGRYIDSVFYCWREQRNTSGCDAGNNCDNPQNDF
jgi:hypothetical protein